MPELTFVPVADPIAEIEPLPSRPGRAPLGLRLVTLVAITVPLQGLIAAPFFLKGWGFSWVDLGLLTLLIPGVLGGVISLSWAGVWTGLIWGGLVRVFLVHHVTWSINSACRLWGLRPYESGDQSRDNVVFGVLAMGEGWHHTHHTFPTSARHGLRWWQLDVSYCVIRMLALLGLAWDLTLPSRQAQARRRRRKPRTKLRRA